MCLIRKKEALLKTEWHLTQSQPLLHQIFKEPSIFFSYKKKKKQIKTKKGLQRVSSTWLLQLFPVSPGRKESRLAWESRLPSLPKQIGQWNSLGKKSYPWYLRLRELFYFWWVTSRVWPSFQSLSVPVWQVRLTESSRVIFWCDESNWKRTQTSVWVAFHVGGNS